MSRRKQVKPQHINLEEKQGEQQLQQAALKFADAAPVVRAVRRPGASMNHLGTGNDMNGYPVKVKRPCLEQSHICEVCCGEFFSFSKFLEHKKNCTKSIPVFIMNDSEGLVPSEDFFRAVESHQPHNPSSKDSHREHGGSSWDVKEKPGAKSVQHLKMKTTLPPTPQDLSYLPKGKVANTNVILQALQGTKVAVGQQRASTLPIPLPNPLPTPLPAALPIPLPTPPPAPLPTPLPAPLPTPLSSPLPAPLPTPLPAPLPTPLPAPLPGASSVPLFLEHILYEQQQQLQQIQFTEQIRIQVSMWAHGLHAGMVGADTRKNLGSHVSQQVQGLSLEPLTQANLPYANISPTTSSVPPGLVSFVPRPDGSRVLPNHLPGALVPQAPGSVLYQIPFSTVALDPSMKGEGKPPNMPPVDVKPRDKPTFYRYKCKYCSKVFGTESCLQVHLRSHTGDRPFMCSVCGYWFTTENDLTVHFYQHFQVEANPQLLVGSHDRMETGIGTPYAFSVPVPTNESSFSFDNKPVLVTGTPNVGLPQNLSWETNSQDLMGGPLVNYTQPWPPESENGYQFSGVGPNHNYPRVGGLQGRGAFEPGAETLKLQQLVENNDKATTNPNECPICHRVFSCQSSLKVHYRSHTRESSFMCKTCDRNFSTKSSLNRHLEAHRTNTSIKARHSCPICQKKFTNAVMLQQHIRGHMDSQIPNTRLLTSCDFTGHQPMVVSENGSTSVNDVVESTNVHKITSQAPSSSTSKVPMLFPSTDLTSPMPRVNKTAPLVVHEKVGPAPVVMQQQSSRGNGLVESGGLTDLSSSVMGGQKYQSRSTDFLEVTTFQAFTPANSQAKSMTSKFHDAGGKAESSGNNHTEMKGWSSLPSTIVRPQPTYARVQVPGAFGPTTTSPGMAPLLAAQPCQQGKQHGCTWFGKASLASALQIHDWTHTGEKPFMCNICGQAFPTKGNLQAHYMTHGANNSSAYNGRKQAIENTVALLGTDAKRYLEMFPQETMAPSMNVDPVVWNHYTTMLSGDLAEDTNEISGIQRVATFPFSLGASSAVDNTTVSEIDGSQSAINADVGKSGAADSIPKH